VLADFVLGKAVEGKSGWRYLRVPDQKRAYSVNTSWDAARAAKYSDASGGGEKSSQDLNARFANSFYVFAGPDYQKLRLKRNDILQ
jgi:hypothetical protein